MFEGFTLERIDVGDAVLRVRHGGSGPPVLLVRPGGPARRAVHRRHDEAGRAAGGRLAALLAAFFG